MSKSLDNIFSRLGLTKKNGLHRKGEDLPDYPSRIKISLKSIDYDAIYNVKNKPLILFKELNVTTNNIEEQIYSIHKKVWNFGEVPILFIVLPHEIRIYNGFIFDKDKNEVWKKISEQSDELNEFSFMNIVSGTFWKKYEAEFSKETRVHDYLLRNLKEARGRLHQLNLPFHITHNLIGRLIFSRYLIDRKALSRDFFYKTYKCDFEEIILNKEKLYDYFEYLKTKFNGDMFISIETEKDEVHDKHLQILYRLFKGHEISTGQTILFDIYDFSVIPIELISNIYETFLAKENMNSNKSYYTPLFLVDNILNQTLDEILKTKNNSNCKILDPACGSGVFLVESLRRLIEKEEINKGGNLKNGELKRIVLNNIFGVDQDEDAINLSIFSIYLTLLDYQEPKDIEKFKFPVLKNKNLFVSDFFDLENDFNRKIKDIALIVGNSPWGSVNGPHIIYCENNNVPLSYKQIAQSFLVRVKDFTNPNTRVALIVTSKILYNLKANKFREYFLKNFVINRVLDFSSVRRKVFKNAIGPGAVIFYRFERDQNTRDNVVQHISLKQNRFFNLFRTIVIEKYDVKHIQQKYFIEYDWLWKVVLYGNILDFHFIKRLKQDYKTLNDIIEEKGLIYGVGVQRPSTEEPKKADQFLGKIYLDPRNMFQRNFINTKNAPRWEIKTLHRIRNPELFEPPYLLIKKGLNRNFQSVAAFSDKEMVFTDSVAAIKGKPTDVDLLRNIQGLLNSKLFTYYILSIGSSTGIERDQVHKPERLSFPIILNKKINQKVEQLERLYKNIGDDITYSERLEADLDETIFDLYELSGLERDLVHYAIDISIPVFKGKNSPFEPPTNKQLMDYAQIFVEHFRPRFARTKDFFYVEIYQIDYFIAMNFKVLSKKSQKSIIFSKDEDINRIINSLGHLSIEEIRDDLYIQRDVKGFEKTSFYVIKPNEYKAWHRAVARLDLSEFIDAMIKTDLERSDVVK